MQELSFEHKSSKEITLKHHKLRLLSSLEVPSHLGICETFTGLHGRLKDFRIVLNINPLSLGIEQEFKN